MPNRLHRYYGAGYSHFITTSCYQRLPLQASRRNRDLFLRVLERVRRRYHFVVVGYVVMPEHVHLLLNEPQRGDPSVVMKALKQGFARCLLGRLRRELDSKQMPLWQTPVEPDASGSRDSTISLYSPNASEWRSCGICIAIR